MLLIAATELERLVDVPDPSAPDSAPTEALGLLHLSSAQMAAKAGRGQGSTAHVRATGSAGARGRGPDRTTGTSAGANAASNAGSTCVTRSTGCCRDRRAGCTCRRT
ncbi:hypothetical protein [Saccharothrix algeriensis]|uniref:Uncharacterized protein n=1 Tax=Saccharothrix algeriensis TaxID=173560 RepID=A0ABS2S2W1_9PSEU|nr:hypothetical protein [Saccharothrix algeriensis]MBM7810590.1 hypothetical protein [Saccharothrix algeriensis]